MKTKHTIITGNSVSKLDKIESHSISSIITSPPYNIGKDYGEYKDKVDRNNWEELIFNTFNNSKRVLQPNGSFFLNVSPIPDKKTKEIIPLDAVCYSIGKEAGYANSSEGNQSNKSIWIGYQAGYSITDSVNSVMIGYEAGKSVTTGDGNVLLGYQAGDAITTKTGIIAIGLGAAGAISTTGDYTIAIGYGAMGGAEIGDGNIAIGYQSMQNANAAGFHRNIALGYQTMANVGSNGPDDNVAIGYQAANALTTSTGDVIIGSKAAHGVTTSNQIIAIGFEALGEVTSPSNERSTQTITQRTSFSNIAIVAGAATTQRTSSLT